MPWQKLTLSSWGSWWGVSDLLCSCSLRDGKTDPKNGIGAKLCFIWGSIKLNQELINLWLVLHVDILFNDGRANDFVDIGDSLQNTFSTPLALISIAKLACLVLPYYLSNQPSIGRPSQRYEPVEAPDGTIARWRPVSVTTSTSTVGLPRES